MKKQIASIPIDNFTTKNIRFAKSNSTLQEVHELMEGYGISHIPICDSSGTPVGIIADRDVRAFYLSPEFTTLEASQIMQKNFLICCSTDLLKEIAAKMVEGEHCAVIVTEKDSNSLAIFTVSDALRALNHIYGVISK